MGSNLFDGLSHDGASYDAALDGARLNAQTQRVFDVMRDGAWRTLAQLAAAAGAPEASVSARLRDLRKPRFGGFVVSRRRVPDADGLWQYRLEPPRSRPSADSTGAVFGAGEGI